MVQFLVYRPGEDFDDALPRSALPLSIYLDKSPSWRPALEETFVVFESLEEKTILEMNPFGLLDFLYPQFQEAATRLEHGHFALLRDAGDWSASYWVLEPVGDRVNLSLLGALPAPYNSYFPLSDSPFVTAQPVSQKDELYRFTTRHRNTLRPKPGAYSQPLLSLQRIDIGKTSLLVNTLRKQAHPGERLCQQ